MNILDQAYSIENFREQGYKVIDLIAGFLEANDSLSEEKTLDWKEPSTQYNFWKKDFSNVGSNDPIALFQDVMKYSINVHNKKYMGHQIAVTPPLMALSSMVINILNNGMGVYEMGMVGNSMEKVIMEDIIARIGFDNHASGFVVTGGTIGNLTALLAARAAITGIWEKGNEENKFAILVSAEAHYSVDRAARIMGLGASSVIKISVDENFSIVTSTLNDIVTNCKNDNRQILCVIGCACTTATGSFDNLYALGQFCKENNIWFHVDGAHGGATIYSNKYKHLVNGINLADSVIIDFHKMMMTPSLSTALIFRNGADSYKTFSQQAAYLWRDEEDHDWYNSGMRTLECTKSMSILNVYTLYKTFGSRIFQENIDRLFDLASSFYDLVKSNHNFEFATPPQSNIVCFRCVNNISDANNLNSFIRKEIVTKGEFYIVQVSLNNKIYLRLSLMNPLTTNVQLKELIETIILIAGKYHK